MRMKLRLSANMALLVVLLLTPLAISYASPTRPKPASIQPALLVTPTIFKLSLMTRTPDVSDPTLRTLIVPSMTSTPEILAIAPEVTRTAVDSNVYSQIIEPTQTTLPDENSTPTPLVIPNVHGRIIEPTEAALPDEDRTPTRLVIPAIRLDAPIETVGWHTEIRNRQPVNIWDVPNHFAAGWLKTSAPAGMPGNTVLDGHHNILGKVFEHLVDLDVGDFITLYTASQERVYRVEQKLILEEAGQPIEVRQANAQYIAPTEDERLTLVTCWPPTGNAYRLIIIARPVSIPFPALPFSEK